MSFARARYAAPLLLALVLGAPSARAQEDDVIPPRVIVRQFPQGQFCALPVSISFIAPATPIKVTFTALQFAESGFAGLLWTNQAIDNVSIATTAQVVANTEAPSSGNSASCYDNATGTPDPPVAYFHFNRAGLTLNLLELFDSDPVARGWDLSDGAAFVNGRSAPRNVENDSDESFGCVVFGDGLGTPVANQTKSASVSLAGLTEGVSYDLGAWWDANFVRFPFDTNYLTVTITTGNSTVVARKTWGALKRQYR